MHIVAALCRKCSRELFGEAANVALIPPCRRCKPARGGATKADTMKPTAGRLVRPERDVVTALLDRAGDKCEDCACDLPDESGAIHHGGTDDVDAFNRLPNLAYLCIACHRRRHRGRVVMTPEDFRRKRLTLGLTRLQIATMFGRTTRTISRYETGRTPIPRRMIERFDAL